MKLLFLAPANSAHSTRWIRWFSEQGHEVAWISAHPLEFEAPLGVTWHILPAGGGTVVMRWIRWLTAVRAIARATRPDVVHIHSLGTYAALAFAIPSGVPMVATPWGSDIILDLEAWWRRAIVRHTLRRSVLYTCDAQHMRRRLAEFGVDPALVKIINFGVETERFLAIARQRHIDVAAAGGGARPFRVISLRLLDPIYDISTLVRAVQRLKDRGIRVAVDIHASGPDRARLEQLVADSSLGDVVTFHGRYSQGTLPGILSGADLYVSTSTSDAGIAASTAEAMAAGLPVIISDSGENAAWITDRVNGRLFPTGNDEALATAIEEAAAKPGWCREWAEAGQQTILERNDYQTEMLKMEVLYKAAVRAAR